MLPGEHLDEALEPSRLLLQRRQLLLAATLLRLRRCEPLLFLRMWRGDARLPLPHDDAHPVELALAVVELGVTRGELLLLFLESRDGARIARDDVAQHRDCAE